MAYQNSTPVVNSQLSEGASCPVNLSDYQMVLSGKGVFVISRPSQLESMQRSIYQGIPVNEVRFDASHSGSYMDALDLARKIQTCVDQMGRNDISVLVQQPANSIDAIHLAEEIGVDYDSERVLDPCSFGGSRSYVNNVINTPLKATQALKDVLAEFFTSQRRRTPKFTFENLEPRMLF